jgi:catechol 2,3-dioxygenase-like lactoylglutathione lyase family enzyme
MPFRSTRDFIIRTEAFDEAVRFYQTALGLTVEHVNATMVGFDTGAFKMYVEKGPAHGPVFEYLVPEVAAAKRQLLAAGCTLVEEDPAQPRCYVRDPYGVVFNIGKDGGK